MMKVNFYTLGCKVNQYETEAMKAAFIRQGYEVVSEQDRADVSVINTCTVTHLSDKKSRQFIRRAKKLNPQAVVAAVGCYVQVSPEEVAAIEGVNIIVGNTDKHKIVSFVEDVLPTDQYAYLQEMKTVKQFEKMDLVDPADHTRAFIKIQDGCNQFCSYCIIPYARGPIRSRAPEDIIKEATYLRDKGYQEVVLTGIHIASYGLDTKGPGVIALAEELAKIEGINRIRLGSIEQSLVDDAFIKAIGSNQKICPHFHLSLQSGSKSVLSRMNRKYDPREFLEKVRAIRQVLPQAAITTDLITGFPGETLAEHQETLAFIKEVGFRDIHVFKYSPRSGTPAADLEDQVSPQEKARRSEELMALATQMRQAYMDQFVGKELKVLFEDVADDLNKGYTKEYIKVACLHAKHLTGEEHRVKIEKRVDDLLVGKLVEEEKDGLFIL